MIRRNITQNLLDALTDTPVLLLNGARQTGKSTLAQSIAEKAHPARYITLDTASVLAAGGMIGPLFENFVVMELKKQITWSATKPHMFHFRTQSGQEVDIVLEDRAGNLVGIEVKASATVHAHDFKGLRALAEMTDKRFLRGIVLYTGTENIPFGECLTALPVQRLWQK